MSKILIIVPAYNEAESILQVVDELKIKCPEKDYVVINDGSTDATRKLCHNNHINYLDLPINVGLAGAIQAGMKYANYFDYDYAVQIDGDGQHMPEYIDQLVQAMQETGADIVIGSRYKSERKPVTMRMIGSQMITYAIWLTTRGKYIGDVTSGMRLFNKKMIKRFGYQMNYQPEPDTLAYLLNHGIHIEEVQVQMRERMTGVSYLGALSAAKYMIHIIFNILILQWFRN